MSHYKCQSCGIPYNECTCDHPHIVPDAVAPKESSNVTPIKPTVKPADPVHVDLRFDPGYPMDTMLAKASAASLKGALVIGYKPDGSLYIDTNINDGPLAAWALNVTLKRLLSES